MKKSILLIVALVKICSLFGQQIYTTNWGNSIPKIRLIVKGIDTLLYEEFRESGSLLERRWQKDSIYVYDRHGIVIQKQFFNKKSYNKAEPDSVMKFFPDGRTKTSKEYTDKKGTTYIFTYSFDGKLERHSSQEKKEDNITKTIYFNSTNQKNSTSWVYPNLALKKDTLYYETGEIRSVFISKIVEDSIFKMQTDSTVSFYHFDKQGHIVRFPDSPKGNFYSLGCLKTIVHDSIKEKRIEFGGFNYILPEDYPDSFLVKNQGNLYGLVDQRGEWVLLPQFDAILTYRGNQFKVQVNGKLGIISKNGKWLIPPQYDEVKFTHLPNIFIVTNHSYKAYPPKNGKVPDEIDAFPDFTNISNNKKTSNNSTAYSYNHTRYGLVDTNGVEVLSLKYKQIQTLNWRSPIFLVETGHPNPQNQQDDYTDGWFSLFDANKGFIIDTTYKRYLDNNSDSAYDYNTTDYQEMTYTIFQNSKTHKAEIFNHFGQSFLNATFDKIEILKDAMAATQFTCGWSYYSYPDRDFYPNFGYLLVHNKGKSGIYSLDNQKWVIPANKYDTIVPFLFKHEERGYPFFGIIDNHDVDAELVLLAKKEGKWWILDKKGQPVWDSYFETMGEIHIDCPFTSEVSCFPKIVFGIRNGKITVFTETSYPKQSTVKEAVYFEKDEKMKRVLSFDGKKIDINTEGVVYFKE